MNAPSGLIAGVRPGSLAAEAGIEQGDRLIEIAGKVPRDVVDVQFHQADAEVSVLIEKANGLMDAVVFEKAIDEDLGFEFERATWDDVILCNNNCFFCFLKGIPKGMRKTLYIKDDDYRLSFLHGNFVTLTNLTNEDWQRLEEQRLSPLNVSVHATELDLRRRMLGNPKAPDILEQIEALGKLGLRVHTQIVLCPGVNDGEHLVRSVLDLANLYPTVQTVSVVPVGASPRLEDWSLNRDGIELVRPNRERATKVVELLRPVQRATRRRFGRTIVQCSDEFYVTSGLPTPGAATYDGFAQYENGIGMVRRMRDDWTRTRRAIASWPGSPGVRSVAIASGTLIAPSLAAIGREFEAATGVGVEVVPVVNTVFGERVNVSGLLCGEDLLAAVAHSDADVIILPRTSLDYFGVRFLDSLTVEEFRERAGKPVAFASHWSEVWRLVRDGIVEAPRRNTRSNGAFWSETVDGERGGATWETELAVGAPV